jgi:hypothetical protein
MRDPNAQRISSVKLRRSTLDFINFHCFVCRVENVLVTRNMKMFVEMQVFWYPYM